MLLVFALVASAMLLAMGWYAAKRDLTAASVRAQSPMADELREMRDAVEGLIAILEQKAAEIEDRLQAQFARLEEIEKAGASRSDAALKSVAADRSADAKPVADLSPIGRALELMSQGGDARSVAESTGLTLAEIETAARVKELRVEK
jgi:Flp pilus assembly CpaE family ATPase